MKLPELILGTANWAWTTDQKSAFSLLEKFLAAGHREIDTATNYPINRNPSDFRAAEKILAEFVNAHGLRDLKITVKIGSQNNLRTPDMNLSKSFVLMMGNEYRRIFRENLHGLMIHWDSRSEKSEISETLEAFQILKKEGLQPGLSGISHPEIYADLAGEFVELKFDVQFKHNILQSHFEKYKPLKNFVERFSCYGINAGGVKLDKNYRENSALVVRGGDPRAIEKQLEKIEILLPELNAQVRPPIKTMNHIGLIFSALHPEIGAILLGTSTPQQLAETLDFYRNFEVFDYSDAFEKLSNQPHQPIN